MRIEVKISVFVMFLVFPLISPVKGIEEPNSFPYQEGWPVIEEKTPHTINQSINVADVNGDGRLEVFLPFLTAYWLFRAYFEVF